MNNNGYLTISGGVNDGGGSLTISGTSNVNNWENAGVITVNSGGVLLNHANDLTSYGGARITVNSGGTLNADSQSQGVTLDLQDSLLVNNGTVTGTTNVYYGATVQGSGTFGPVNVSDGGMLVIATSASPLATSLTVSSGSIAGAGQSASSATVAEATIATPNVTDTLKLSGNLSGAGPVTKTGAGTLILSGDDDYAGGTDVEAGTLVITSNTALPGGSNLTVGAGGTLIFDPSFAGSPMALATASQINPVPEPGTLALLACGGIGLVGYGWRRRTRSASFRN